MLSASSVAPKNRAAFAPTSTTTPSPRASSPVPWIASPRAVAKPPTISWLMPFSARQSTSTTSIAAIFLKSALQ